MFDRVALEKKTISKLMVIYCCDHHQCHEMNRGADLCMDCKEMEHYAYQKIDRCPFARKKPACSECKIHCYTKDRLTTMIEVMRYAGPRIVLKHPLLAVYHIWVKHKYGSDLKQARRKQ